MGDGPIMADNKIALVTGAGSGIGRAVSLALQGAGYSVVLAGRRVGALEQTARLAQSGGGAMLAAPTDVGDPAADQWNAVVSVNLTGPFLCAQEAIKIMKAQTPRGGRIINNGSISAHVPRPNSAPYTATKHAITGLTKCISLDGRKYDIACGQIDIGNAGTDMTARMAAGVPQADGSRKPEPVMDVRHVADAVLYMASLPLDANVQFMTVMATNMPFVGRG